MTILVTGAHGFVGRHVSRSFAQRGHEVVGMGHGGWKSEEWQSWGLRRWTETDISIEALEKFGGVPEVIVHCAGGGSVPMSVVQPYQDFERTVISMANVLEYIRLKSPATRLVFPSSAAVYGNAETMPIKEEDRCAPISPYGVHKLLAEQLMTSYANAYGVSCVIVRFFSIYGCGLRKQLLWDACGKIAGGIYRFSGTGSEVRDWLHIDDAAELLRVAAAQASTSCPIANGGSGQGVSVRELLAHVATRMNPDSAEVQFSAERRAGDPSVFIANIQRAVSWDWRPISMWRDRTTEYVAWWRLEMGLDSKTRAPHGKLQRVTVG